MNRNESSTSSSSRSTSISAAQSPFIVPPTQNYRSISLIDSIQFKVDGNLSKNSVVLADCDNDDVSFVSPMITKYHIFYDILFRKMSFWLAH